MRFRVHYAFQSQHVKPATATTTDTYFHKESLLVRAAAVWDYVGANPGNFATTLHRTCGTAAIKDGILFIADFSGLFHCVDAKSGKD